MLWIMILNEGVEKDMGLLDNLKRREKIQYSKMQNSEYYFSEESKIKGKQLYHDKKEYIKNNPDDFLTVGANIFGLLWNAIEKMPIEEQKIFRLTGEGKYYEDQKDYKKAISLYQQAYDLTMDVLGDEIQELIEEHGPGDYLYTYKIKQRIRVCEKKLLGEKCKKLELEAKSLEKTNPAGAIEIYMELNRLKPGLKKYDKRIEICKKKVLG